MRGILIVTSMAVGVVLAAVDAMGGAPINDVRLTGTGGAISGTVALQSGGRLELSGGTVVFGSAQVSGNAVAYPAQAANRVLASGTSGTSVPAFRALALRDLGDVAVTGSVSNGQVLAWSGPAAAWTAMAVGGGIGDPTTTKGDLIVRGGSALDRLPVGTSGQVLVADATAATGVRWGSPDAARVRNSAATSIPTGTITYLTFNTEDFNIGNLHSTTVNTGRLTAQRPGIYLIMANIVFDDNANGARFAYIQYNGSQRIASGGSPAVSNQLNVTAIFRFAAGDYVQAGVFQDSGSSLNVKVDELRSPIFSMVYLGN